MKKTWNIMLVLLFLLASFCWLIPRPVQGITCPSTIRVGLSTTETVCDFRPVAGTYQISGGTSTSPLAVVQPGTTTYRAAYSPEDKLIKLYTMGADGSWNELGTFDRVNFTAEGGSSDSLFSYNNKVYRGSLTVALNPNYGSMVVVNSLCLEAYLYGVVPREMSNSWPLEALKAQAVAARTYVVKNINKHGAYGFDVCDKTHCQVYGGYNCEGDQARRAVDETRGEVLVDSNGNLIYALYHSNSGGHTEDNSNVNGYDFPYLKGKPDPYSLGYGLSDWSYTITVKNNGTGNSLAEKLAAKFPEAGPVARISLSKYPSGRVYAVIIEDENGKQFKLSGSEFGQMFNPGFNTTVNQSSFMGTLFEAVSDARVAVLSGAGQQVIMDGGLKNLAVRNAGAILPFTTGGDTFEARSASGVRTYPKSPQIITITGHGWGHGVGMSQWGAYAMAQQSMTYRDILQFYYEGTKVIRLE